MQRDKTKDMTFEERKAYYHKRTAQFFASTGKAPKYASPYGETDSTANETKIIDDAMPEYSNSPSNAVAVG